MFSRLQWLLLQLSRRLWVRATAFSVLGVITPLIALLVKRHIPDEIPAQIGADAVDSLLQIIATSMLSVMIFSLSTLVSAYASATSNTTPRATQLLMSDSTAQNSLATFLGAFLFSLVGIIVLQIGLYGDNGRVVLYAVTLGVIVIIVLTLVRWTDYVLGLGRVAPTCDRVENVAASAMRRRRASPHLSGQPREAGETGIPDGSLPIHADSFGYVEHIDMQALQKAAEEAGIEIYLVALPGHFAGAAQPLVSVMSLPRNPAWKRFATHSASPLRAVSIRIHDSVPAYFPRLPRARFLRQSTIPVRPSISSVAEPVCSRCGPPIIRMRSTLMQKRSDLRTSMYRRSSWRICSMISSFRSLATAPVWSRSVSICKRCCKPWPALGMTAIEGQPHDSQPRHWRVPRPCSRSPTISSASSNRPHAWPTRRRPDQRNRGK